MGTDLATWRRSPVSVSVWSSSVRGARPDQQLPDLIIGCPAPRAPPLPESQAGVHGAKQIQLEVVKSHQLIGTNSFCFSILCLYTVRLTETSQWFELQDKER